MPIKIRQALFQQLEQSLHLLQTQDKTTVWMRSLRHKLWLDLFFCTQSVTITLVFIFLGYQEIHNTWLYNVLSHCPEHSRWCSAFLWKKKLLTEVCYILISTKPELAQVLLATSWHRWCKPAVYVDCNCNYYFLNPHCLQKNYIIYLYAKKDNISWSIYLWKERGIPPHSHQ